MLHPPNDVILEILERLEWRDIIACRQTCHRLKSIIEASVLLQYRIELAACGMLDGERGPHTLPVHERLERLKLYQEAWLNLTWTENNDLAHLLGRNYSDNVTTGVALGFPSRLDSTLLLQTVPSFLRGIDEDHKIFDGPTRTLVRLDLSQDLWISMNIPLHDPFDVTYYLKSISTGDAHPLAHDEGRMRPFRRAAAVDYCGNYVLQSRRADSTSSVFVHNWKTGIVESEKREYWSIGTEEYRSRNGWFLDENYILLDIFTSDATGPRPFQSSSAGCLVIVPISPSDTRSYRFFLPEFFQDLTHWAHRIISRCTGGLAQGCFYADHADRLLSLRPSLRASGSSDPQFVIDIPVRTFRAYIQSHPGDAGAPVIVPWEEWGPRGTRITLETATGSARAPRTSVHGMRRLSVRADGTSGTVTVLDYHPRRVARALARGDAKVVHGGSVGNVVTLLPCIETMVPLPEGPARSLAAGRMLAVWLCENGVLFVESLMRSRTVTNAWVYSI
ncbi:hypothetical protein BV25DRAFT_1529227 [Artomyces pyxidatus]|uniref:Uncharacterized protein n=1 Tax=Artomyces pyxidatus TaxID=48021 RepID=A0ACB8TDC7_9AGAM|nr:hypothetical protein BV25DRAFT_1529227 [Artomyces pyxidatus]